MSQEHDRFFMVIDELSRKTRLVFDQERDAVSSWDVLRCYNRKLIPRNALFEMNPYNSRARYGATHCHAVNHSGEAHVVHVPRRSGHFLPTLFAWHRFSDVAIFHRL